MNGMRIKKKWIVIFLLPATILFAFVYAIPLATLFGTSFTKWIVASKPTFNGLGNFVTMFQDKEFWDALKNTLVWMLLQSTIHVAFGVVVAFILARKKFYWKFTRTVFMLPNIISSAAVGMLFVLVLNPSFGAVNSLLTSLGFTDLPNWFMDKNTAFFTLTMTWLPYAAIVSILIMAEMTSISDSILEAATIDGASEFQKNIYIVFPLTKNIIGTTTILAATSMLQKLDIVMLTTKGGPGSLTMNLPLYVYNTAFTANNFGQANATGLLMVVLGLVVVGVINKIYKTETYI